MRQRWAAFRLRRLPVLDASSWSIDFDTYSTVRYHASGPNWWPTPGWTEQHPHVGIGKRYRVLFDDTWIAMVVTSKDSRDGWRAEDVAGWTARNTIVDIGGVYMTQADAKQMSKSRG